MAQRVVLHVGSMKSGTSYLQGLMMTNRELLAERGLLLPGRAWRDQVSGVAEVLERTRVAVAPEEGAWRQLVDELARWDGTGLISMEFLGPIGSKKIERVVSSFPAGTVEVVITARDVNRQVPAMWQEGIKNGRTFTFEEYVDAVRRNEGPGRVFWREQSIAAICRRWSDALGLDRVRVVTVPRPHSPQEELWRRFSRAVDIDGDGVAMPRSANESLGAASIEVLRRLNELVEDLEYPDYAPVVKHRLAKRVLAARRASESAVAFDVPEWLPERASRIIANLRTLGVEVFGDLADLEPVSVPGVDPDDVSTEEHLDAAVAGLEGLARALVRPRAGGVPCA